MGQFLGNTFEKGPKSDKPGSDKEKRATSMVKTR